MNALMFRADDGIGNQGSGFDAEYFAGGDSTLDNLSISLDDFYAILGDDSDPSINHSPCSQEDLQCHNFLEGDLNPVAVKHEKASQSQDGIGENLGVPPVEASLLGSYPWYPSSDYRMQMEEEFYESSQKGSFSEIYSSSLPDYEKLDNLQPFDNKFPFSGLYQESDWLTLSSSEHDTCSRDSAGGSVDALIAGSIDNHHLHNDMPNCSIPFPSDVIAGEANHFPDCKEGAILTNGSPFLLNVKKEFPSDINFASAPPNIILQNNRIGSSLPVSMEKSALTIGKYENTDTSSMGDSRALEGGLHALCKKEHFTDPDPALSGTVHVEANIDQVTDIMHKDSVDCSLMHFCGNTTTNADGGCFANNITNQVSPSTYIQQFMPSNIEIMIHVTDESADHLIEPPSMCRGSEINSVSHLHIIDADQSSGHCLPASFSRISATDADDAPFTDIDTKKFLPSTQQFNLSLKRENCVKDEKYDQLTSHSTCHSVKGIEEVVRKNPLGNSSNVDNDADICILEDLSDPGHAPPSVVHIKSYSTTQRSTFNDPLHHPGIGGTRFRSNDERLTFHAALQNLSPTKSEATPPDGFLAVPLLRHQRIALAWMVHKETSSLHCSGGILADDQGLGKTVSTIALILMERAPSSKLNSKTMELGEVEALDLDDDDDEVVELHGMKQSRNSDHFMINKTSTKGDNTFVAGKARPAAGTLVVCPTSVLRQWAEELHNKVTGKANLSVLVYHGSNRTKDPVELAKYDVVLTTYSIVSMEVPKQPLVDQDDEEKGNLEGHDFPMGPSTSRKRKYPPSSSQKSLKDKKGIDGVLLESIGRPLARVGWFRVVLDEAQSIKNHRTQVARACWGLRAKRRWCLSGTPIQNAVDDLYSYFRFLRYDPYAVYKSFCSTIKIPINRNPTTGYKKLQAVLKTIMLRRTKATLLDGEPIINLPPKTVSLKKVEFSDEERAFYSKLEADSRDQFKVYAAAGTVKQNYVNILLMLLRLRQACDHPHLVKGYNSNSVWKSSFETAKKLPKEKQRNLLNCLEACLAICGICNDPPEDAVVTTCGHVFCNQCICEHLTGDENSCPATQCKVLLSVTSVFSKATLRSSLSEQPGHDFSSDKSGTKLIESPELCAESMSSDSSKIKAALEILQSLSKPQLSTVKSSSVKSDDSVSCQENISDSISEGVYKEIHLDKEKGTVVKVGEKAIVFSQWTRMLDLLEVPLRNSSIQYRRLDGTMSVIARDKAVKDFNNLPEVSVMIMSLKAASLGLNMVAACHVLLLDLWWNPTTEDQAIDRAHRIGQTRAVTVSRLTVKDTVEDRILALQQKKREMVASAFGEDEAGGRQTRLTVDDLKYLFMV